MKRPGEAVLPEPVSKSQKQDLDQLRNQTLVEKLKHQDSLDVQHREISAELFFLEEKGNLFDYSTWRDQPSAQLLAIWEKAGIPPEVVQPLSSPVEVVIDEDEGQVEEPISIKCPPTDDPDASEAPADSQLSVCSNADSEQNVPVENIVEKAKQEAWVISRIAELKKEGMWTAKRLPKCVDPPRVKTQWDYVLDEMQWLATDFEQERRWKRMAAKKLALAIVRQNKEVNDKLRKAELDKEKDLRKIASFIGKEIMLFWKNARKVIEYRTRNLVEAKKKKALDTHLDLIVDRSEKYSALLQENLQRSSRSPSLNSDQSKEDHDADFNAGGINSDASDDETTIAQAEKQLGSADNDINEELRDLEKVGDMEVDDLLDSLPPEYLELLRLEAEKTDKKESVEPGEDRPTTSASTGSVVSSKESNQESLQRLEKLDAEPTADTSERESELSNIAQAAEKFQPTGFTLETTKVVTTVPFLIKHTLREYQHVGLDWLVALNKRNLNGILADEMGLGKTIQTIALLAYLACEDTNWGPHLVVVPTSVMLNWEMEFKKWCPSFKILTYYGTQKERAEKRKGWTKPNAFHVCITSYKIVLTDQRSFRNRRWRYFILDEAQNIKNFKSQRWQLLLNFNSEHRLLLTGTPLQNNLLELWSLMHFLMPGIFTSHRDFKDWFANPLTGMVEGSKEYNDGIVKRLHKVLRPFLLRRLKVDVEKQMPKKYEHVLKCHLSKRQRYLYDDFMSRKSVKDSLTGGNMMSIINILMQLRKVCNHPNLFEPRPIISPFSVPDPITLNVPSAVCYISVADPTQTVTLPCLSELENSSPSKKMSCRKLGCVSVEDIIELNERTLEEPLPKDSEFSLEPKKKLAKLDMNSRRVSAYGSASSSNGHKVREDDVVVDVDVESDSNKPQFVIPCQLAQHLPFDKPFLIRINTNRGWQLLPIMSKSPLTQAGAGGPLNSTSTLVPNGHIAVLHLVPSLLPNQPPTAELLETVPVNDPSTPDRLQALMNDSLAGADAEQGHSSVSHGSLISAVTQTYPKLDAVKVEAHDDIKPVCSRSTSENKNGDLKSAAADQFKTPSVERKRKADKLSIVDTMLRESRRRDLIDAIYGQDLQDLLRFIDYDVKNDEDGRLDQSTVNVLIDRFVLYIPGARSQRPTLRLFSPDQSLLEKERSNTKILYAFLSEKLDKLHKVATGQTAQFPELRLIEYDCGKLQMMSKLLKELYPDGHRVLIFTQMSKMLDILEAFLCSHGYKYLRLDGTTKVEQRHLMMERFNHDSRIFCFILSTRAGGIGVNLTGADTVIFYDSDWNPTMDAQAQDRCHRIGQTRDVHIYRLICEKTVEENILKKAQQKKLLSDMAIEGGAFTVDFFKPNSIRDLFDLTDPGSSNSVTTTANAISDSGNLNTLPNIESELAKFEDEQDVIAAKEVEREVEDDLAEFDENKPIEDECDRVMKEMNNLVEQLSGIEKYAVKFLEVEMQDLIDQELEYTEATIAEQQRGWELSHSQAMENMYDNVGDNQQMEPDDVDLDLTYPEEDAVSQMFCPFDSSQSMPLWAPPTPPRSEGEPELYLDSLLATMYNEKPMTEFQLPPVYVDYSPPVISHNNDHLMSTPKQEDIDDKASADGMSGLDDSTVSADDLPNLIIRSVSGTSLKTDPSQMMRSGFSARSLFDQGRSNTTTGVGKRDRRMSNYEVAVGRDQDQDGPEWQVYEELALMETLSKCQNLPTSLQTLNPGHVPNWDFASMQLANVSPFFRGHTQCKQHYENFVAPREDGRMQQNDPVLKRLKMNMALGDASLVNLFKKGKVRTQMLFDHEGRNIICDLLMQRANSLKEAARKMPLYQMGKLNYGQSFGSTSVLPDNHVQSLQSHGVRLDPSYRLRPSQALELREQRTKELEKKREQDKIQQLQVQQQNQQQKNITVSLPTQVSFGGQPVGISFAQQRGAQNVVSFTQVPASAVAAMVRNQQQQAIPINTRNIAAATIQGQSATTGSLSSFYQRNPLTPATGNVPTQVQLVGMPAGANSVGHMSQIINTTTPPQQNARSMSAIGSFTTVSFPATTAGIQADGGNAVYVKQLSQGSGGTQLQLTPHHQQYRVQNLNASPQNIQQGGINVIRAGQNRIQFGQNMGGSHSAGNVSLLGAGSSQSTSGNVGSISYQAMRSVRNSTPQSHSNNSQPQFHISQTLTSAPPRMTPPNSGSQN